VVQRRLVQKMRLTLAAEARGAEPSEAELAAHLAAHRAHWTEPARVRATQLYFATRARAEAVGPRLSPDPARALALGEALPISAELAALSEDELARALGPRLAAAVFALAPGAWSAPLESTFGWHRVFVRERVPERATPLATVRGEVRAALLAERDAASVRATLAAWRARWRLAPEPAL
jgi:hypothetical protein